MYDYPAYANPAQRKEYPLMCGGVRYNDSDGREWRIYFPSPKAALPVRQRDGSVRWMKWGRRREEEVPFVRDGWARIDSLESGKWARFHPIRVTLAVQAFMQKDAEGKSHWIEAPEGCAIQGLIAHAGEEERAYVVTHDTPPEYAWVHGRWPLLVALDQ